uniref:Apple domain-containing protein n=1 Tax=Haemonchus contortus TaxID=6289 RepID=A0A7I5EB84_HAECO
RNMLLLKAFATPSVSLLFLMQAHSALLCTFTITTSENVAWNEVTSNKTTIVQSEGVCLKQCLEDFPDCCMVVTDKVYGKIFCFLYQPFPHKKIPLKNYHETTEKIYVLERDKMDSTCPLADTVLPA